MRKPRRVLVWIGCLAGVALAVMVAVVTRGPEEPDFVRKPAENAGYSNLLAAVKLTVGDVRSTNFAEVVKQNQTALEVVQGALKGAVDGPVTTYEKVDVSDLMSIKDFYYVLAATGQVAESEKQFGQAARAYYDGMRLGEKFGHGPMINFMVGAAVERGAMKRMEGLIPKLSMEELRFWAREIQESNRGRMSFEEIMRREHYFMARNATNFVDAVKARFSRRTSEIVDGVEESHTSLQAQMEVLAATMAAVSYLEENSEALTNASVLAPKYLKSAPVDPYGEGKAAVLPMVVGTNGAVFYSMGKNRIDEQGKGDDVTVKHEDGTAYRVMFRAMSEE